MALTQHGPVWVTCTEEERFLDRNLAPAIRTGSLLMVWRAIYKEGRSKLVRLEREDGQGKKQKKGKKKLKKKCDTTA